LSSALCTDGGSWGHSPSSATVWAREAPGKRLLARGRADARPSPAAVTPPPR